MRILRNVGSTLGSSVSDGNPMSCYRVARLMSYKTPIKGIFKCQQFSLRCAPPLHIVFF